MTTIKNVLIIGAGHMGSAIAVGLKRADPTISITIFDPDSTRTHEMLIAGMQTMEALPEHIASEITILAIPPKTSTCSLKTINAAKATQE